MYTAKKLLKALQNEFKKRQQSSTMYAIAKRLEVSQTACQNWAKGKSMDDDNAAKIAEYLGLNQEWVLACMHAERAKGSDSYEIWKAICQKLNPEESQNLDSKKPRQAA